MAKTAQATIQLPPELLDDIFACLLEGGKNDLKSCAQVCSTWRTFAQSHLFRQVVFTRKDGNEDPDDDTDHRAAFAQIRTFFERHADLAAHVRDLSLRIMPCHPRCDWLIPPGSGYHTPSSLLRLLHLFPRLDHLFLQDVFVTPEVSLEDHSLAPLSPLKVLKICSRQEEIPSSDISLLLNLFTEVDTLDLTVTCYFDWRRQEARYPLAKHLTVSSLSTSDSTHEKPLLHIAQSPSAHTLHTISLGDLEAGSVKGVQDLLLATRHNLEFLRISFRAFWMEFGYTPPVVSLASCSALRRLELSIRTGATDWQAVWGILASLSADTSGALEDIAIEMHPLTDLPADEFWRELDPAALRSTYETLSLLSRKGRFKRLAIRKTDRSNPLRYDICDIFPHVLQRYVS